ncbi:MAG: alkaline phosphatase family protein [Acidobacteriota bacterium]|nr:alkaline phosphatase family protein [Acidobacteriota bacterium]
MDLRPAASALLSGALRLATALALTIGLPLLTGCQGRGDSLILVTISGLRADSVTPESMPRLSSLMEEGISRRDMLTSVPDTIPALASLMTGQGPETLDCFFADRCRLPSHYSTLAESFAARGYRTAAFIGQGAVSPLTGLARGFQTFTSPGSVGDSPILPDETHRVHPRRIGWTPASVIADQVGAFFLKEGGSGSPKFLWVHLADPAYAASGADPQEHYRESLAAVDETIGYLRDALASFGLEGRTTLAVVALHGTAFGDGGETGHGLTLVPSVIRVVATVLPAESSGDAAPIPPGITAMASFLAPGVGLEPAPATDSHRPTCMTRWPSRLYGWPNREVTLGPSETPQGDAPALDDHQRQVLALMARANRARLEGDLFESTRILERARKLAPSALAPRSALAGLLGANVKGMSEERLALRRQLLTELEAWKPGSMTQALDLARTFKMLGDRSEALKLIRGTLSSVCTPGQTLAAAEMLTDIDAIDEAIAAIESVVEQETSPAPELQEWLGDLLLRSGNQYRARQAYQKALISPRARTPHLLAKLGDTLAGLGEADKALESYAAAVAADPSYRYPHAQAATILLEQGQIGAAAHAIAMSVPEGESPRDTAIRRARRLADRKLFAAATAEIDKLLAQMPGDEKLLVEKARLLRHQEKPGEARQILESVLENRPQSAKALTELAILAALEGDQQTAISLLDRAEPFAGASLAAQIRSENIFHLAGEASPLAQRAARFRGLSRRRPETSKP